MASDVNLPNKEERDLNQSWWACVGKHAGVDSPVWKILNWWMRSCGWSCHVGEFWRCEDDITMWKSNFCWFEHQKPESLECLRCWVMRGSCRNTPGEGWRPLEEPKASETKGLFSQVEDVVGMLYAEFEADCQPVGSGRGFRISNTSVSLDWSSLVKGKQRQRGRKLKMQKICKTEKWQKESNNTYRSHVTGNLWVP